MFARKTAFSSRFRVPGLLAFAFGLAHALIVLAPNHVWAWCQMTTNPNNLVPTFSEPCVTDGFPLQWDRRCTAYAVDGPSTDDLPRTSIRFSRDEVRDLIAQAFDTWHSVVCSDGSSFELRAEQLADLSDCGAAYEPVDGNVNAIIFRDNWEDLGYDSAAYAYTTVWHNIHTGEIYDADMEINEARGPYMDCATNDCDAGSGVDLLNVVTHEVGHYFGLAHSADEDSTMYAMSPPGNMQMRTLETDDVEGICSIYPAADVSDSCYYEPRNGLRLSCDPPAESCSLGGSQPGVPNKRRADRGAVSDFGAHRDWVLVVVLASAFALRGVRRANRHRRDKTNV